MALLFLFSKILFNYLKQSVYMRERERGGGSEGEAYSLLSGKPDAGLRLQDYDLSRSQMLNRLNDA